MVSFCFPILGVESGLNKTELTTQLEVKTILNRVQPFPGFVYNSVRLLGAGGTQRIEVIVRSRENNQGKCSHCQKPSPGYDTLPARRWDFVPLWAIAVYLVYASRRVECAEHGIVVEHVPWSSGKSPLTMAMMIFLATWARRLSWRETARVFQTSWEAVYRSVDWYVQWGLAHRVLEGVKSIGIDEIFWGRGRRSEAFLTVIYQIDGHCRRLLWVGRKRTQATLHQGLDALGAPVVPPVGRM